MTPHLFTFVHVYSRVTLKNTREYSRLFTRPFRGVNDVNGVSGESHE
jgi:hypothetical protein